MDCRLQQRCMCLSFKRHGELFFFSPPSPFPRSLSFHSPPPRHLMLLRHSYKQAAEPPAHGDAGGGGGEQGDHLFPRVWSRRLLQRCKDETCRFFNKNPATREAPAGRVLPISRVRPRTDPFGCTPRAPLVLRSPLPFPFSFLLPSSHSPRSLEELLPPLPLHR